MYVIRGLGSKGNRSYYTGRAGDGWLSDNIANAFRYSLLEGARRDGRADVANYLGSLLAYWNRHNF